MGGEKLHTPIGKTNKSHREDYRVHRAVLS